MHRTPLPAFDSVPTAASRPAHVGALHAMTERGEWSTPECDGSAAPAVAPRRACGQRAAVRRVEAPLPRDAAAEG